MMRAPQLLSPTRRADTEYGANRTSPTGASDSTKPAASADFAAICVANRHRLPMPERLAELGRAL